MFLLNTYFLLNLFIVQKFVNLNQLHANIRDIQKIIIAVFNSQRALHAMLPYYYLSET